MPATASISTAPRWPTGSAGSPGWCEPLADRIGEHVMAGSVIHADDTPIPVLAPGNGKTKTGRLWVYLRDERPHAGPAPPAVLYRYTPDRKGEHCRAHLAPFGGHLHADGYSGFRELYESAQGMPAAVDRGRLLGSREAVLLRRASQERITDRQGSPRQDRRTVRHRADHRRPAARATPARSPRRTPDPGSMRLETWFDEQLKLIPGKSDLAGAIRYARSRWDALTRYVDDGRLEISNNAAENAIRPLKLGAKNWLFLGSDAGGERAAIFYTLIRSARLNGIEPEAYLRDVLTRIGEHPINRLDELLPWHWAKTDEAVKLAA